MEKSNLQYRPDIDGLRAISILAVVLYHAGLSWLPGGFVGVDIFFVISGFLITSLIIKDLGRDSFSIAGFYERRIRRIFPALATVFLFTSITSYILFLPEELINFGKSLAAAALSGSNMFFWKDTNYFSASVFLKPLLHTWSLGVEEQFYIIFPLVLLLIKKFLKEKYTFWIVAGWILSLLFVVAAILKDQQTAAFYFLPMRAWELLTGAFIAIKILPEIQSRRWAGITGVLGLAAILASIVCLSSGNKYLPLMLLLPCIGAALVIYAGRNSINYPILSAAPLVFIGKISYSLYLWHWPVLVFLKYYLITEPTAIQAVMAVALSFVLSILSWKFIEQPFRERKDNWSRKQVINVFLLISAIFTILGLAFWKYDGFPQRLDPRIVELTKVTKGVSEVTEDFHNGDKQILGDLNETPSYVLWGDSHATSIDPAIDKAAINNKTSVLMLKKAGCMPTIDQSTPQLKTCLQFNEAVYEAIKRSPEIDGVILAARWSAYPRWWESDNLFGPKDYKLLFEENFIKVVKALQTEGKDVIVFVEPPASDYFVPSVLARLELFNKTLDIRPKVTDYLELQKDSIPFFKDIAQKYKVKVIYPQNAMCDEEYCDVVRDGKTLYFDGNHLSANGAALHVDAFDKIFNTKKH